MYRAFPVRSVGCVLRSKVRQAYGRAGTHGLVALSTTATGTPLPYHTLARHGNRWLGNTVSLKRLLVPYGDTDEGSRAALIAEAQLWQTLRHRHVRVARPERGAAVCAGLSLWRRVWNP